MSVCVCVCETEHRAGQRGLLSWRAWLSSHRAVLFNMVELRLELRSSGSRPHDP